MNISRLTLVVLLAALATSIRAETINCTPITSLPATITTSGIYCLTGNLGTSQTSGNAITVSANYVMLDLNGWKLDGHKAGTGTTATGISSTGTDVTIKNGIVRGFAIGIDLTGNESVVRDLLVNQSTETAIWVTGAGALVEHNQVMNSGGSTTGTNVFAYGIRADGINSTVSDNMVSGLAVTGTGSEYGILFTGGAGTVRNNLVSNTALPGGGGSSFGIVQEASIVLNNTVSEFNIGIFNTSGIYAYNTASSCGTTYVGGTAGAGNSP